MMGQTPKKARPVFISGFSSQSLAESMAKAIGSRTIGVRNKQHPDREIEPALEGNVRGLDAVYVASAAGDPNKQIFETQLILDTIKRAGAKSTTLVLPYMWYGRSDSDWGDRKSVALTRVIKNLRDDCDYAIVADPHNPVLTRATFQEATGCTTAYFAYPFAVQLKDLFNKEVIRKDKLLFLHPDAGSVKRIGPGFRDALQTTLNIPGNPNKDNWPQIGKDRDKETNESETKEINVDVKNMDVVIFEDMIASGGTACDLAEALKAAGARSVILFATSGLFTPKKGERVTASVERVSNSKLDAVFITNTYDHNLISNIVTKAIKDSDNIHTLDVTPYMAAMIDSIYMEVTDEMPKDQNSISAILRGKHPDQEKLVKPVALKSSSSLAKIALTRN